ncbi:magnesium transporter CorA family protein [Jiangella muralis]|uniref:magnesium transporter CorA family protein n=1 Tax=Jiangella muralis TaxID=702383 RepID=UPI00069F3C87|nr:CorA family divalent cation transporter [Jiangella muralis]
MTTTTIDSVGEELRAHWIQVAADDTARLAELHREHGIDFATVGNRVWESDDYVYLPLTVEDVEGDTIRRETIVFALGHETLVTLQPSVPLHLFNKAIARMRRTPALRSSAHGIMYALLWALNESEERVVEYASEALEDMSDDIEQAAQGQDDMGRQLGVGDMRDTMQRMNQAEEVLSRVQESQLKLIRAARHLRTEIADPDLAHRVDVLVADIDGVKQHASFEHDKVRYMQQSIMTTLDIKQNEIVKVFTIITAVFLPPTLIATFYGMNFTGMPELNTEHGFLVTTVLTLVAAIIPLWYIKQRGWLR